VTIFSVRPPCPLCLCGESPSSAQKQSTQKLSRRKLRPGSPAVCPSVFTSAP
jgi:hypothetical protein